MTKYKNIKELLEGNGERLTSLRRQLAARSRVLEHVVAALPAELGAKVATAGVHQGELTIGASSAAWAARLRYKTELLRQRVGTALGVDLTRVRVKVVSTTPSDYPAA